MERFISPSLEHKAWRESVNEEDYISDTLVASPILSNYRRCREQIVTIIKLKDYESKLAKVNLQIHT